MLDGPRRVAKTVPIGSRGPGRHTSRAIEFHLLKKIFCLASLVVLCLASFQNGAHARTVLSQCTNPVCKPGKPCAEYRCAEPPPCLDYTPPPVGSSVCVVGYAFGNHANSAGGNVPGVLIESTDDWEIDGSGNVWYGKSKKADLDVGMSEPARLRLRISEITFLNGRRWVNSATDECEIDAWTLTEALCVIAAR
jgi:hypothetical protein